METETQKEEGVAIYVAPNISEKINMSGISEVESDDIKDSYAPFLDRVKNSVILSQKIDFENPKEMDMKIARDLRLVTRTIRTDCEKVKKERKRLHSLKADIEQLAYNLVAKECEFFEEKFAAVEKIQEIKLKAEKESLKLKRLEALAPFGFDPGQVKMEDLPEQAFEILLSGLKQKAEEAEKAAAKAEADKIETAARAKRKEERIKELMNLGAKMTEHGEAVLEGKNKANEKQYTMMGPGEIEHLDPEKYLLFLSTFREISKENSEYEKTIEAENERMKKEAEESELNQKRYNARVKSLTELGAITTDLGFSIKDATKDQNVFIEFSEVMVLENENFTKVQGWFKTAKHNNDYQIEQSRMEAAKIEDQRKRAVEAKEKRYNERLAKLTNFGARIKGGAVVLKQIGGDHAIMILLDNVRESNDQTFDNDSAVMEALSKQNNKRLDLEKEANKIETERREKAEKELADQKAAKIKADKEAEDKRIAELEAKRKAALAPDKEKLLAFAQALKTLPRPELKANEATNIMAGIEELIGKTVKYLTDKATQL